MYLLLLNDDLDDKLCGHLTCKCNHDFPSWVP